MKTQDKSSKLVADNKPLSLYMDTKWLVKSIVEKTSSSSLQKYRDIRHALIAFNNEFEPGLFSLGIKGRVYLFLFRHRLAGGLLILELALASNVKRYLPTTLANYIVYYLSNSKSVAKLQKDTKKIIVTLVPDHGNLGDLAIGFAQRKFLDDNFKEHEIVEIPISQTYGSLRTLRKKMSPKDIIMITGGGNLGTLYKDAEAKRRFIIRKFAKNKIILFPQSTYFSDDRGGRKFLEKSIAIYGMHNNLTLLARDQPSFDFMKKKFTKNQIELIPDTVLYLDDLTSNIKRKKQITLSVRRDIESSLNTEQKKALKEYVQDESRTLVYQDTNIDNVQPGIMGRKKELDKIWRIYQESEIVITDRLHGVIFCVITNTPCIAINNKNGKVANLYNKWLSEINYISMLKTFDAAILKQELIRLSKLSESMYKKRDFKNEFRLLRDVIAD